MGLQPMVRPWSSAVLLSMLLAQAAVSASTLRCEGGVVSRGDAIEEVLARCGSPQHVERYSKELKRINHIGIPVVREVQVERWTYDRGVGKFVQILIFESGRLQRFERGPRR